MRRVILDTETTGLDVKAGDRVIEVGCVELGKAGRSRGRGSNAWIKPGAQPIDAGAVAVHGLTDEFPADKPKFAEIADDLAASYAVPKLVIHNAAFDVGFLNREFRAGRPRRHRAAVRRG